MWWGGHFSCQYHWENISVLNHKNICWVMMISWLRHYLMYPPEFTCFHSTMNVRCWRSKQGVKSPLPGVNQGWWSEDDDYYINLKHHETHKHVKCCCQQRVSWTLPLSTIIESCLTRFQSPWQLFQHLVRSSSVFSSSSSLFLVSRPHSLNPQLISGFKTFQNWNANWMACGTTQNCC